MEPLPQQECPAAAQKKTRVGIALCGFGRAGKIHFHSIRQNQRCILRYVVDLAETLASLQEYLDEYNLSDTTKPVSTADFEKVHLRFILLPAYSNIYTNPVMNC